MSLQHALRTVLLAAATSFLLLTAIDEGPAYGQGAKIRVALFIDSGTEASEFVKEFRRNCDDQIAWRRIDGDDVRAGALTDFDAIVIPGGSASEESDNLGAEARQRIRDFVKDGGIYLGVCAGAYLASSQRKSDLGLLPLTTIDSEHWYRVDDGTLVDVELTPAAREVFGIPQQGKIQLIYENGPIFAPPLEPPDPSFTPLAFFASEVVGDGGRAGVMLGAPAIVLSRYGRGIVLVISPHPEETPGFKQVEIHALHWLYDHRNASGVPAVSQRSAPTLASQRIESGARLDSSRYSPDKRNLAGAMPPDPDRSSSPSSPRGGQPDNLSYLSAQALQLAESIFNRADIVKYEHRQVPASRQVTDSGGEVKARTDCSGFISYIVHAVAPRHYAIVKEREPDFSYPQAKIWARFFDSLDNSQPRDGWLGITNWHDLRPGDLIAWVEGKSSSAGNTGHVMMVAGRPSEIRQERGYRFFEIAVIDSSTTYHFAPERLPPQAGQRHRDGLGIGCVRIILSQDDAPVGYWAGTYWGEGDRPVRGPTMSRVVRFARMLPAPNH